MCDLGLLYESQNKEELAVEYYKMGIDYNKHPRSMVQLGKLYQSKGQFDLAENYYKMAVDRDYPPAEYLLKILKKTN